jgi:hypothetical protein
MDSPALHLLKAKLQAQERREREPKEVSVSPSMFRLLLEDVRDVSRPDSAAGTGGSEGELSVLGVTVREDDRLDSFDFEA